MRDGEVGEDGRSSCEEEIPDKGFPIEADEWFPCVPDEGRHSIPDEGTDGEEGELPAIPVDTTWLNMKTINFILRVTWFWLVSGEVRILLAGLLWLPLLVLFELRTRGLVTLLTEAASLSHDSFRLATCHISNIATICAKMLTKYRQICSHLFAEIGLHGLTS